MTVRTLLLISVTALTVLFAAPAFAQGEPAAEPAEEPAEEPSFEQLIQDAKTAYENEEYQKAIDLLLYAHRVEPNPRLLINVARSYDKMGDCVQSLLYYRAFVAEPEAEEDLVEKAQDQLDAAGECEGYDESLSGRFIVRSEPRDAVVSIDGENVGTTPLEVAGLPAGTHTVKIMKRGMDDFEKKVELKPAENHTLEAELEEPKDATKEEKEETPPPPPIDKPEQEGINPMLYAAGGVAGLGVGLLTLGFVYDLVVIPSTDDERSQFAPGTDDYNRLTEERSSEATIAIIGYVSGGILVAAGGGWLTYLLLTEGQQESENQLVGKPQLRVTPFFSEENVGVGLSGRF